MTPKDKAQDLFVKFYERCVDSVYSTVAAKHEAKWAVQIIIDEILSLRMIDHVGRGIGEQINEKQYWQQVKQELEKL